GGGVSDSGTGSHGCDAGVELPPGPNGWNRFDGGTAITGSLGFPLAFAGMIRGGVGYSPSSQFDLTQVSIVIGSEDQSASCTGAESFGLLGSTGGQLVISVLTKDGGPVMPGSYSFVETGDTNAYVAVSTQV